MLDHLNPRQRQAVIHLGSPLLVLAGAGSGKTRVITHKIAYLIQQQGLRPQHIIAVTFTNKAAKEMKERVGQLLDAKQIKGLSISTFHTLGLKMIKHEPQAAGLRPYFSIMDEQDSLHLLKEIMQHLNLDESKVRSAQAQISQWKNDLCDPQQALEQAQDELQRQQAHIYEHYQRTLQAYNAVDFDDLILLPVKMMQQNDQIRQYWQQRLDYLLVDEYQDTNLTQYELVRLLVGDKAAFTVVGDDDQSIYAWRGARPENLAQLKQDYPQLTVIKLEQNYRSTNRILHSANHLISHNPHLFEKRLWSQLGEGEKIEVISCKDEEQEAERVIAEIQRLKILKGYQYGDFAILYRSNYQARYFEKALRHHNLPYVLSGGQSFFARTEIKDIMAYLRLLANPNDDPAFLRVINVPKRQIGIKTLEKLNFYAAEKKISLLEASLASSISQTMPRTTYRRLQQFALWLQNFSQITRQSPPAEAVEQLLAEIAYQDWLQQISDNEAAAQRRWDNVQDLVAWIAQLQKQDDSKNLADMVSHLSLMDILERQDQGQNNERISLMTLHAAKGLEFPCVFLVGMEEDLLPHHNSPEEEERRLAYVGITRAKQRLYCTYARQRRKGGEIVSCDPSRFLSELPQHQIQWPDGGQSKKLSVSDRRAYLAEMKRRLATD